MSWGYTSHKSKFYFSEKEIDFTAEHLNYEQFLLQEFFTADLETAKKISDYYYNIHGSRSLAYLERNTSGWVKGRYHLTDLMRERITSIMPKFLNENAKYRLGVHEFMASIKSTVKLFQENQKYRFRNISNLKATREVISIFEKEYEKIQSITIRYFRFNVLTEQEKDEALEISKYILDIKLQKDFDQIERDFKIFLPDISKFKRGIFSASYSITAFNVKVDITNEKIDCIEIPRFKINEKEANNRFKEYSDKYLAFELLSLHKETNKAISKSFLNANDIALFYTHYEELINGESEVRMNSTFQGEGGVFVLNVQVKPLKLLKISILGSSIKVVVYFSLIITFVSFVINFELFVFLILVGISLIVLGFNLVSEEIKTLKSIIKEYKTYGK